MITNIGQQFTSISTSLAQWSEDEPALEHVFRPVQTWLDAQDVSLISPISPKSNQSSIGRADSIIDGLLINVQAMLSKCPITEGDTTADDNDNFIRDGSHFFGELTGALHVDGVFNQLLTILPHLVNVPQDDLPKHILRFLPFLDRYAMLIQEQLIAHSQWTQAVFKLDFVLCSIMHTIAKQGFCKPPESDESGSSGDATDAAGVGLGEGSGTENVSKDIEDESQVEGIQGDEDGANGPKNDPGDDNTIEMSEDFGGALEDVPDDGSQNDDASDEESQVEPDEQLGDLDASDPAAVDEKLWGDEQGPQGNDETEKATEDRSEEQGADSDVVAREDQRTQPKEPKEKAKEEVAGPETEEDTMPPEDTEMDDGTEHAEANGAPLDDHTQDANTLDLPDDMDLGLGDEMPQPDLNNESEDVSDVENVHDQNISDDNDAEAESPSTPEAVDDEPPGQVQDTGDSGDVMEEEHSENNVVAQPDISAGEGGLTSHESQKADTVESAPMGQQSNGSGSRQGQSTEDRDQTQKQTEYVAIIFPSRLV